MICYFAWLFKTIVLNKLSQSGLSVRNLAGSGECIASESSFYWTRKAEIGSIIHVE
jgi:hypothetical protein